MNIRESIKRILREESKIPAEVRRRINASDEKVKERLNYYMFLYFHGEDIQKTVHRVIEDTADYLLEPLDHYNISRDDYTKIIKNFENFLFENYSDYVREYIERIISDDEKSGFCFMKHKEHYGGYGFTDCGFNSWNELLKQYGKWLPLVNWIEVKEKLNTQDQVLLTGPLEGHRYNDYFSVRRK